MYKPQTFRLATAIHWPGAGSTTEIHTDHVSTVSDEGDSYVFKHASGYAAKVAKATVTSYGTWEDDNIPNLPDVKKDKKDSKPKKTSDANKPPLPSVDTSAHKEPESGGKDFFDAESLVKKASAAPEDSDANDADDEKDSKNSDAKIDQIKNLGLPRYASNKKKSSK